MEFMDTNAQMVLLQLMKSFLKVFKFEKFLKNLKFFFNLAVGEVKRFLNTVGPMCRYAIYT